MAWLPPCGSISDCGEIASEAPSRYVSGIRATKEVCRNRQRAGGDGAAQENGPEAAPRAERADVNNLHELLPETQKPRAAPLRASPVMAVLALLILALLATVAHSGVPHTVSGLSSGAYAAVQVRRCPFPLVPVRRARPRPPARRPRAGPIHAFSQTCSITWPTAPPWRALASSPAARTSLVARRFHNDPDPAPQLLVCHG